MMPTDTSDQQITMPVDADAADNPVAFVNNVADVEPRLVRRYTDTADRTARMASLSENAVSTLATENRAEIYDGANHVSLYTRSLFAMLYKTANQTMNASDTTLQNVTSLVAAMPTTGTFSFRGIIYYDAVTAGDIKFGFTVPAGASLRWNGMGIVTGSSATGDATFTTITGSGGFTSYGGGGAGVVLCCQIEGEYAAGGTAGNLQFQAAQSVSDVTAPIIIARSRLEIWRHI
jgi:hypothetical protein